MYIYIKYYYIIFLKFWVETITNKLGRSYIKIFIVICIRVHSYFKIQIVNVIKVQHNYTYRLQDSWFGVSKTVFSAQGWKTLQNKINNAWRYGVRSK